MKLGKKALSCLLAIMMIVTSVSVCFTVLGADASTQARQMLNTITNVYDDLKKLVESEDKRHPLSDDALCDRLKEMGYKLERRTVAKYRDALKIPSSTVRRKMAK